MNTIYLQLDFSDPDERSVAGNAWIGLRYHPTEDDGLLHITPHCAVLGELEWQIDRMQQDLETIRKHARRKFADAANKPRRPILR